MGSDGTSHSQQKGVLAHSNLRNRVPICARLYLSSFRPPETRDPKANIVPMFRETYRLSGLGLRTPNVHCVDVRVGCFRDLSWIHENLTRVLLWAGRDDKRQNAKLMSAAVYPLLLRANYS